MRSGALGPVSAGCAVAGDSVSRHGGRPLPELTTRTEPPGAVVVQPGTIVPGRARGAAPLRREGPAKLTGTAMYTDDLVVPGRLVRRDDPLDRRARHVRSRSTSTPPSTGRRSSSSPRPTSRATTSSARSRPTSRSSSRSAARSSTTPSRWRSSPPPTGRPCARRAHARHGRGRRKLPAVFDPLASDHVFAAYDDRAAATPTPPSRPPTSSSRASTGSATRSSSTSRTTR